MSKRRTTNSGGAFVDRVHDVICSDCGEPWSEHDSNHQPSCDAKNRYALRAPRARERTYVVELVAVRTPRPSAANSCPALARRFAFGGRR